MSERYHRFSQADVPINEIKHFYKIPIKELPIDRPYVWFMFVQSADGIGSLMEAKYPDPKIGLSGPGIALRQFSGRRTEAAGSETDHRLLEAGWAFADAVIAGSGILKAEPFLTWMPEYSDLVDYQKRKKALPIRVLVTGRGFDKEQLQNPVFHPKGFRTLVATSETGFDFMEKQKKSIDQNPPTAEFRSFGSERVDFKELLRVLKKEYEVKLLDLQGGPDISGQFFKGHLVDEYRLTIAPAIAGYLNSQGEHRPQSVKASFTPDELITMNLRKIGIFQDHLFLRYKVGYEENQ